METKSTNSDDARLLGTVWPENSITSQVSIMNSRFIKAYSDLRSSLSRVEEIASQVFFSSNDKSITRVVDRFKALKDLDDKATGQILDFLISGSTSQVKLSQTITRTSSAEEMVGYIISCLREVQSLFKTSVKAEDAKNLQYIMSANDSLAMVTSGWGLSPSLNSIFRHLYTLQKCSVLTFTPRIYEHLRGLVGYYKDIYKDPELEMLLWLLSWADSQHETHDYMAPFVVSYTIKTLYKLPDIYLSEVDEKVFNDGVVFDKDQLQFLQAMLMFITNVNEYLPPSSTIQASDFLDDKVRIWSVLAVARLLRGSKEKIIQILSKSANPLVDPNLITTFSGTLLL